MEPPATTDDVIAAAKFLHDPPGGYGVAWNAARGTALGHTFMMTWPISASRSSTCRGNRRRLRTDRSSNRTTADDRHGPPGWRRPNT
jgi:hypothetical protein